MSLFTLVTKVASNLYYAKHTLPVIFLKFQRMEKRTRSYVEEAFRQILEKPGVEDVIILNRHRNPVQTTMTMEKALQVTGLVESLRFKTERAIHKSDPKDELIMLRVASYKNEIILAPDGRITVIVQQKAKDEFQK